MTKGPNIPGHSDRSFEDVDELFFNDRLDRDYVTVEDYPARIDQAAMDHLHGVSIGRSKYETTGGPPMGGVITNVEFDRATGEFYRQGLVAIADELSSLHENVDRYEAREIGGLAFRLNEVQYELQRLDDGSGSGVEIDDLVRVIEAIVEKVRTRSMRQAGTTVMGQSLHDPETVTDAVHQILSDPSLGEYADEMIDIVADSPGGQNLLSILDAPEMVTPLWDHQRQALEKWLDTGKKGYVDMATATGKSVLGLAAIAAEYGALHPIDESEMEGKIPGKEQNVDGAEVLIVAGQEVILEQWRSEFDEHFDIPRDRTRIEGSGDTKRIRLQWGTIEFMTAQKLLATDPIGHYDLVILDEAHQYSRGSRTGRGWGAVFDDLVTSADAILAMSGSVDYGWMGDEAAKNALQENLTKCIEFSVPEAREQGVIADFTWEIRHTLASDSKAQDDLVRRTRSLAEAYDDEAHEFDLRKVDPSLNDDDRTIFETLTDLRSFGRSKEGESLRGRSEAFDELATAALARRPHRWQLSPPEDVIADLVAEHAPDDKVVVLVQSYPQAELVADRITEKIGEELVVVPESGGEEQFESIQAFNEAGYRVIVGPGNVLGTGIDMPEADTAINISKGGVNASLIQRIGRILRNPSGDKRAKFYQFVTLPGTDDAYLLGEDGRRRLRRSAEFRGLGTRLRELPDYTVDGQAVNDLLGRLERAGSAAIEADHRPIDGILADKVARDHLVELVEAIDRSGQPGAIATMIREWDSETLERDYAPVEESAGGERNRDQPPEEPPIDFEFPVNKGDDEEDGDRTSPTVSEDSRDEGPSEPARANPGDTVTTEESAPERDSSGAQPSSEEVDTGGYDSGGDTLFGSGSPDSPTESTPVGESEATTSKESEETGDSALSPGQDSGAAVETEAGGDSNQRQSGNASADVETTPDSSEGTTDRSATPTTESDPNARLAGEDMVDDVSDGSEHTTTNESEGVLSKIRKALYVLIGLDRKK